MREYASVTETKNYILGSVKIGESLNGVTPSGRKIDRDILDYFVRKGIVRMDVGGPGTYGHISYVRIY